VTGADYTKYMDIQQAINLSVFETFEREKIEMAYPTQTLFVNKIN
jgi:small-conductance mechanosensitive channel